MGVFGGRLAWFFLQKHWCSWWREGRHLRLFLTQRVLSMMGIVYYGNTGERWFC